jgi:hypothetical protein
MVVQTELRPFGPGGLTPLPEGLRAGRSRREIAPGRLRERIRRLNPSQLGQALNGRTAGAHPPGRELSPELVLVDPELAAWARSQG